MRDEKSRPMEEAARIAPGGLSVFQALLCVMSYLTVTLVMCGLAPSYQ